MSETAALAQFMREYRAEKDALAERHIEVYVCCDSDGVVVYVGRTDRFAIRWRNHRRALRHTAKRVEHFPCETYADSLILEAQLIRQHQPPFNRVGVDR